MSDSKTMTAQDAKRAYQRKWYAANRDKVRATKERYWQRQADKLNAEAAALADESEDGKQ